MKKNILFIGYGDLGSRLASISKDDLVITGISRSLKPRIVPDQYHSLDWFKNSSQKIDLLKNYDCLIITLTPTSFDEAGYEKGYEEGMKLISKLVKNISFKLINFYFYFHLPPSHKRFNRMIGFQCKCFRLLFINDFQELIK